MKTDTPKNIPDRQPLLCACPRADLSYATIAGAVEEDCCRGGPRGVRTSGSDDLIYVTLAPRDNQDTWISNRLYPRRLRVRCRGHRLGKKIGITLFAASPRAKFPALHLRDAPRSMQLKDFFIYRVISSCAVATDYLVLLYRHHRRRTLCAVLMTLLVVV